MIETISLETGEVLAVQKSFEDLALGDGKLVEHKLDNGKIVLAEPGMNLDRISTKKWKYSETLAEVICQKIREGQSYTAITKMSGFPSANVLAKWRKQHPEFHEMLEEARRDRAEFHHDAVLDVAKEAETVEDPRMIQAYKLQVDALKWSAERNNPERYGNQVKVKGDPNAPVTFFIDTGIRKDKPDYEEIDNQNHENVISIPQDSKK